MVHFCMEWNETKNVAWNRRGLVCRVGCVISCAYSLMISIWEGLSPGEGGGGGGGGGTVILSSYVGSDPASGNELYKL